MSMIEVEINCPDEETAQTIAEVVVAERLAACANVHAPIQSRYWWEGDVVTAAESPLVVKTRLDLFDALVGRVEELHPYEVPGIIARSPVAVNESYSRWVDESTVIG